MCSRSLDCRPVLGLEGDRAAGQFERLGIRPGGDRQDCAGDEDGGYIHVPRMVEGPKVRERGPDVLLEEQLDAVGEALREAERADPVGADPLLHPRDGHVTSVLRPNRRKATVLAFLLPALDGEFASLPPTGKLSAEVVADFAKWIDLATRSHVPASIPLWPDSGADGRGVYGFNWWTNGLRHYNCEPDKYAKL